MFSFAYNLERATGVAAETQSELELRYSVFLGGVVLQFEQGTIDADWGWVPLLDFAACHLDVARTVRTGGRAVFEFTESDAALDYWPSDGGVLVEASWVPEPRRVNIDEFVIATVELTRRVLDEAAGRHPELTDHPLLREMRTQVADLK